MAKSSTPISDPVESIAVEAALQIKYVPLTEAALFDQNVTLHDIGAIAESIKKYGFRNPPIWDKNLNNGQGGLVAGNGRLKTLLWMKEQGTEPPRGIAVDSSGDWCIDPKNINTAPWLIPIVFGCDAESELEARAYAITDNLLTMSGGNLTPLDMSRVFDQDAYLQTLIELNAQDCLPVGVDGDDLELLLKQLNENPSEKQLLGSGTKEIDTESFDFQHRCPKCGFEFDG